MQNRRPPPPRSSRQLWPLWIAASAVACTGALSSPDAPRNTPGATPGAESRPGASGQDPSPASGAGEPAGPVATGSAALRCEDAPIDPGPAPLRLLSREQYANTLRDLFGAAGELEGVLASAAEPSAFGLLQADVSQLELEDFQKAADAIAARSVADKPVLSALVPCSGSDKRACARAFVASFGARAYRAPLTDAADLERHLELYDLGAASSHEHGIELVLRGMLQSPRFLYRVELGTPQKIASAAVALSPHELAARLSYVFWKTLPDAELSQAAASGKLASAAEIEQQLTRMLAHKKGEHTLRAFLESFMHLGELENQVKDESLYPEWKSMRLRSSMTAQARRFLQHVLSDEGGTLSALLTSKTVFANQDLAGFYGVSGGAELQPFQWAEASGLLSLPALLTIQAKPAESSPINRGKFVREALLCEQLPTPPANIPKPPEVEPDVSTRERLRQHEVDPACSVCHKRLDPIGFGFERFDAIGRPRQSDGGKPIDARGELLGTRDLDGTFTGVAELGERLAASGQVESCMTRQWFRFALSRFEQPVDECVIARVGAAFEAAGGSLHALPKAIVQSDAFRYRRPIDSQEAP